MAKHRPHGPKGHSSGRPKSGQRSLSGARPGGSGPRPRPGGGPAPSGPKPRRPARPKAHGAGPQRPSGRRRRASRSGRRRRAPLSQEPRGGQAGTAPEGPGAGRARIAAGLRGADRPGTGHRQRPGRQRARHAGRPRGPDRRQRRADPPGVAGLLRRQQARGLCLDQLRPFGTASGGGPRRRDPAAGLHRRAARRGQHRADAPDQRRRAGQPAGASEVRGREAVPGAGRRPAGRPRACPS